MGVSRGWWEVEKKELLFDGCGISVLQDERVMEMDGSEVAHYERV